MKFGLGIFVLVIFCLSGSRTVAEEVAYGVATPHRLATDAAETILNSGGNAFDAAVAVAAVLAVVEPYGSGLGGGGFWLLHEAETGRQVMLDGRERAPLAATADMFQNAEGEVDRDRIMNGALASAIPGTPAALAHVSTYFGSLPLATVLAPAIRLAQDGFGVDPIYQRLAEFRADILRRWPTTAAVFLDHGRIPVDGFFVRQPELAETLELLATEGHQGFYSGVVAARLIAGVQAQGGIWTHEDLMNYRIIERAPIRFRYRDMQVVSVPPPSSGGIALAQIFQILEQFDLESMSKAQRVHLIAEAMRLAYHDRARYLGDADYVNVPVEQLTNRHYAAGLAATIHPFRARSSSDLPGLPSVHAGQDTTHFSIVDGKGNRVAVTLSLNYPFGSGFMPEGTGVLLNNHMDDFTAAPGSPNVYGLLQSEVNAIGPGKRMLSSMSPTFLEAGQRVAVLGTPGGSRIITMILLSALEFERGADAGQMASLPRFHHQYWPDRIEFEPEALSEETQRFLLGKGHTLESASRGWGNMQVVIASYQGYFDAAVDPRGVGVPGIRGGLQQ